MISHPGCLGGEFTQPSLRLFLTLWHYGMVDEETGRKEVGMHELRFEFRMKQQRPVKRRGRKTGTERTGGTSAAPHNHNENLQQPKEGRREGRKACRLGGSGTGRRLKGPERQLKCNTENENPYIVLQTFNAVGEFRATTLPRPGNWSTGRCFDLMHPMSPSRQFPGPAQSV